MNNKKIVSAVAIGVALATPLIGFAQVSDVAGVVDLFADAFAIIQAIFWIVAGIFIIWAAFKYLTAQGDPEKVGEARQMVIYAVIAVAIGLLVLVIDNIAQDFLGGGSTPGTGGGIR